jgi:hypothetical protein
MKIASSIEQYFDDEGRPLVNGRVTFYDHDSDIQAEIFYLVGDEYTAAPNPQITADDGRIPTVFFEASVKDVKVEKQLPDGSYALLDTFEIGFDYPKAANATLAYGIDALKNTDPAVGIVQVVGYYSEFDAPTRWYVWDKNCSLDSDGGVIIESDVGEEGRWILLWDDELLPSSVYGILPNENEANIAGFLSYPDYVGTFQIRTPPIPRFMSGVYTTVGYLQTTKALYFDEDAYFTGAEIHCDRAIVPVNSHYVADFYFTGKDVEAHSSWFKSIEAFWRCTADKLIIDKTNYFVNTQIKLTLELNGEHEELQRIYTEIGRLCFEQAKDTPEGFFVPLLEQANRVSDSIRAKRAKIDELKEHYGVTEQSDIDVEIGDFDDVVSATEADGMTVEIKTKE